MGRMLGRVLSTFWSVWRGLLLAALLGLGFGGTAWGQDAPEIGSVDVRNVTPGKMFTDPVAPGDTFEIRVGYRDLDISEGQLVAWSHVFYSQPGAKGSLLN
ncbi:MAG: hypothetical protein AAFV37_03155, partial [Pseudomonadota bacterium]